MKNLFSLFLSIFFFSVTASAVVNPINPISTLDSAISYRDMKDLKLKHFLVLSPKEVARQTGKKMKLRDRIVLKIAQSKIKKQIKKGEKINFNESYAAANGNFNLGGFLLGFFFLLLGVLIALLFGKDAVRSAWKGFLLGLLVGLLIWLLT